MKTIYLDCGMGASGDMLAGALLELFPDPDAVLKKLNDLSIPGVCFSAERAEKCGIIGTHMVVKVHGHTESDGLPHDHAHSDWMEIEQIVSHLDVPETVRKDILAIYGSIAQAESEVHGVPVQQIHFHEVGSLDAVADVTAVCMLLDMLRADQIIASAVHVGAGQVHCADGILPVPAPATVNLLRGIPMYSGDIQGELCTPTGAALLRHFVTRFGEMPSLCAEKIGYGMGTKDFPRANCLRAILGDTAEQAEEIYALSCNLDDMTGEEIGYALERLFDAGALDAYTLPIQMKKSRPGILLQALCKPEDREKMLQVLFQNTSTLGVRACKMPRFTLRRESETIATAWGDVCRKRAEGFGVRRLKWEYEDLRRIAESECISVRQAKQLLEDQTKE